MIEAWKQKIREMVATDSFQEKVFAIARMNNIMDEEKWYDLLAVTSATLMESIPEKDVPQIISQRLIVPIDIANKIYLLIRKQIVDPMHAVINQADLGSSMVNETISPLNTSSAGATASTLPPISHESARTVSSKDIFAASERVLEKVYKVNQNPEAVNLGPDYKLVGMQLAGISEEVKHILFGEEYPKRIALVARKYHLNASQTQILENEITKVLLWVNTIDDLSSNLKNKLTLDDNFSTLMYKDISDYLLKDIMPYLTHDMGQVSTFQIPTPDQMRPQPVVSTSAPANLPTQSFHQDMSSIPSPVLDAVNTLGSMPRPQNQPVQGFVAVTPAPIPTPISTSLPSIPKQSPFETVNLSHASTLNMPSMDHDISYGAPLQQQTNPDQSAQNIVPPSFNKADLLRQIENPPLTAIKKYVIEQQSAKMNPISSMNPTAPAQHEITASDNQTPHQTVQGSATPTQKPMSDTSRMLQDHYTD